MSNFEQTGINRGDQNCGFRSGEPLDAIMFVPGQVSPELCREKAEECVALSYQLTDPKKQVALLKFANSWMRLAEHAFSIRTAEQKGMNLEL